MLVAGARLTVPVCAVVLRKAYGLGAMAMTAGDLRRPAITVAWPTGEFGGMALEGAVRLGYRKELDALEDPDARRARYDELVAEQYTRGQALSTAAAFEIDDVIDPADPRRAHRRPRSRHDRRLNTPQPSPGVGQVGLAPEPRAEPRFVRHQDFSVSGAKARRGPQPGDGPPPEPNITGRVTLGPSSPARQCHRIAEVPAAERQRG
jgi:hypothetical protein